MERTKLLTAAVIGLFLLNLLTIGFLVLKPGHSRDSAQPMPPDREGPARVIIERLHFDTQQQERYLQLVKAHQHQTRTLADQSVQLYRDYYNLLNEDRPDSTQANTLSEQIAQNQRAQAQLNFAHFREIKSLCQPDQQADFQRLVSDLNRLFGQLQRPPRPTHDGPPGGHPEGPPENLPPHP